MLVAGVRKHGVEIAVGLFQAQQVCGRGVLAPGHGNDGPHVFAWDKRGDWDEPNHHARPLAACHSRHEGAASALRRRWGGRCQVGT